MFLKNELIIALTAALPVLELRGSIPLGLYHLKEPILKVYLVSIVGNLLPIPALFFLLEPVSKRLRRLPVLERFFTWLFNRTKKRSRLVEEFETIGLILFVAIPLPMTGAWTGCMAASLLKMPFKNAFPAIILGVLIAGCVVSLICLSGNSILQQLLSISPGA